MLSLWCLQKTGWTRPDCLLDNTTGCVLENILHNTTTAGINSHCIISSRQQGISDVQQVYLADQGTSQDAKDCQKQVRCLTWEGKEAAGLFC